MINGCLKMGIWKVNSFKIKHPKRWWIYFDAGKNSKRGPKKR
jgi:hypothetical protein